MNGENPMKNDDIMTTVVLCQGGNNEAKRDIYINFHKDIFFICSSITGDVKLSISLTAEIFKAMFQNVGDLENYGDFKRWFYSLAIKTCASKADRKDDPESVLNDKVPPLISTAINSALSHERAKFSRCMERIFSEMILSLPLEGREIFFYKYFARLTVGETAKLKKTTDDEILLKSEALEKILKLQSEEIKKYGVTVEPFLNDISGVLSHLSLETFVPPSVHKAVSNIIGFNVDPYSDPKKITEKDRTENTKPAKNKKEKSDDRVPSNSKDEKPVKKNF